MPDTPNSGTSGVCWVPGSTTTPNGIGSCCERLKSGTSAAGCWPPSWAGARWAPVEGCVAEERPYCGTAAGVSEEPFCGDSPAMTAVGCGPPCSGAATDGGCPNTVVESGAFADGAWPNAGVGSDAG